MSKRLFTGNNILNSKLNVGICQIIVGSDKSENLLNASKAIDYCANNGANIVVLPEIWNSPYDTQLFRKYAESIPDGESSLLLKNKAKEHNIYLVGGSIPEIDDDKVYNTCVIYDYNGNIIGKYRKMHLFDINVPGKITFYESDTLTAGDGITMFELDNFGYNDKKLRIGIGICYDIRFNELSELYRQNSCDLLIFPGAFNTTTGPLHWELLQRCRAVDNQMYIITCSPAYNPITKYPVYGHSSIIDPWGKIIKTCDNNESIYVKDIDLNEIYNFRSSIPTSKQKRYDIYSPLKSKI